MTNKEKAIAVAVGFHFSDVDGNAQEIYQALLEADGDMGMDVFPYPVWHPFDNFDVDAIWSSIDSLVSDILISFDK